MTECDKADGTKCRVGDIILDPLAWMLCLPGYRNAAARFKPADEETQARVDAELARIEPVRDETRRYLQVKIDEYAAGGKFQLDPVTGFFKRDSSGAYSPKAVVAHIIETAEGYGLKPVVPAAAAAVAPVAVKEVAKVDA